MAPREARVRLAELVDRHVRERAAHDAGTPPEQGLSEPRVPVDNDPYTVRLRRAWRPPTDVYDTDRHLVVKVEIAGMREEDFRVSLVNRHLIIAGYRRAPAARLLYQNMEIRYGEFRTEVQLGWPVDESAIEAHYREGFIYVFLSKAKEYRVPVVERDADAQETPNGPRYSGDEA